MASDASSLFLRDIRSWTDVPTAILRAELSRRKDATTSTTRPQCGGKNRGYYDTTIHVGGLILILVLSVACMFMRDALEDGLDD